MLSEVKGGEYMVKTLLAIAVLFAVSFAVASSVRGQTMTPTPTPTATTTTTPAATTTPGVVVPSGTPSTGFGPY